MADPFPIYQQVVKDKREFFRDVHGYVLLPNTKTSLAGVRSRVYYASIPNCGVTKSC